MEKNTRCRKATLAIAALLVAGALYPLTALAANKLIVNDAGGTVNKFVVTDTGAIGAGTNNPQTAIHVEGAATAGVNDPTSQVRIHSTGSAGATSGGGIVGLHNEPVSGTNTLGYPINGDRLGYMLFGTQRANGTNFNGAGLAAFAAADWTSTLTPSFLTFETADIAAAGRKTRANIGPNGNIAINMEKNFATQQLEVVGGIKINNQFPGDPAKNPTKPACSTADGATTRGPLWYTNNGSAADTLEICMYNGSVYSWVTIK
jgi:hypothetical protein